MTEDIAYVTPSVVAWALANSSLSREAIAGGIGVAAEDLAEWEQGSKRPPFDTAVALAELLDVPFGYFFLSNPPDHEISREATRSIDVRHATLDDGTVEFDEIFASGAYVHLEKMNKSQFCLIVETEEERACFFIGAKRAPVDAWELWREDKTAAVAVDGE